MRHISATAIFLLCFLTSARGANSDSLAYTALRDSLLRIGSTDYGQALAGAQGMAELGFYADARDMLLDFITETSAPTAQSTEKPMHTNPEFAIMLGIDYVDIEKQQEARTPDEKAALLQQEQQRFDFYTHTAMNWQPAFARWMTLEPEVLVSNRKTRPEIKTEATMFDRACAVALSVAGEFPYVLPLYDDTLPAQTAMLDYTAEIRLQHARGPWSFHAPLKLKRERYRENTTQYASNLTLDFIPTIEYRPADQFFKLTVDALTRLRDYDHDLWKKNADDHEPDSIPLTNLVTVYPSLRVTVSTGALLARASFSYAHYRQPDDSEQPRQHDFELKTTFDFALTQQLEASLAVNTAHRKAIQQDTVVYKPSKYITNYESEQFDVSATEMLVQPRLSFAATQRVTIAALSRFEQTDGTVVEDYHGRRFKNAAGAWLLQSLTAWEPAVEIDFSPTAVDGSIRLAYRLEHAPEAPGYAPIRERQLKSSSSFTVNITDWISVLLFADLAFDQNLTLFNRMVSGNLDLRF